MRSRQGTCRRCAWTLAAIAVVACAGMAVFAGTKYSPRLDAFVHRAEQKLQLAEGRLHNALLAAQVAKNVSVTLDLSKLHPVAPNLFGIFFEEINYAGEGGLYAEMVQDRSFDAMAMTQGFHKSKDHELPVPDAAFTQSLYGGDVDQNVLGITWDQIDAGSNPNVPVSWLPLAESHLTLTKDDPVSPTNTIALQVTSSGDVGGIVNSGFWGISVNEAALYRVFAFIKEPPSSASLRGSPIEVKASLQSADGARVYASTTFSGITQDWQAFNNTLTSTGTDPDARLALSFAGPGTIVVDVVSLFPEENIAKGSMNPWPFRDDLLQMLKDLSPRFLRFPGGCFVEGDTMPFAFRWKNSIGHFADRPGHWNLWGYWSTDGLGLFEYMQLAEELGAEPVWVINNGISHAESIAPAFIQPWVQEALDSIEFIIGPPDSKWGSIRAQMGHPDPWRLNYMAIGNEDCGKQYYIENYIAFYEAIRTAYPHIHLIANCDMGLSAPTELWDYHVYTDPNTMWGLRTIFDDKVEGRDPYIFASEYAVTTGGGLGNLWAAVAEAGFMTGLERNSQVVQLAAYAPLFVHTNFRRWPTNLIVFDNHRAYGIPSYYVQALFARHQGVQYVDTVVEAGPVALTAASATCQDQNCTNIAIKVVNFAPVSQKLTISLTGLKETSIRSQGSLITLTSGNNTDENTFEHPTKVVPATAELNDLDTTFDIDTESMSVNVVLVSLGPGSQQRPSVLHDAVSGMSDSAQQ